MQANILNGKAHHGTDWPGFGALRAFEHVTVQSEDAGRESPQKSGGEGLMRRVAKNKARTTMVKGKDARHTSQADKQAHRQAGSHFTKLHTVVRTVRSTEYKDGGHA